MLRSLQKILTLPLIFSLIFASLFCCCLSESAHAEVVHEPTQHSEKSHCDSHNSEDDHSGATHECECPKLQSILAKNFDILKAADFVLYSFNHQIILDKTFFAFVLDHNLLAGASPPQLVSSSIPLYIKNPTLRI